MTETLTCADTEGQLNSNPHVAFKHLSAAGLLLGLTSCLVLKAIVSGIVCTGALGVAALPAPGSRELPRGPSPAMGEGACYLSPPSGASTG